MFDRGDEACMYRCLIKETECACTGDRGDGVHMCRCLIGEMERTYTGV